MENKTLVEKIKKTLSLTELDCLKKLFEDIDLNCNEIIVNINQVKKEKGIGRSSLVSCLKLLTLVDVLEVKSLGNKGSIIFLNNKDILKAVLDKGV